MEGYYSKYTVTKRDGSPVEPEAVYFVLRVDTDPAARAALMQYAHKTPNRDLAGDLYRLLENLPLPSDEEQEPVDYEQQMVLSTVL